MLPSYYLRYNLYLCWHCLANNDLRRGTNEVKGYIKEASGDEARGGHIQSISEDPPLAVIWIWIDWSEKRQCS